MKRVLACLLLLRVTAFALQGPLASVGTVPLAKQHPPGAVQVNGRWCLNGTTEECQALRAGVDREVALLIIKDSSECSQIGPAQCRLATQQASHQPASSG